jgi:hypothetical protein
MRPAPGGFHDDVAIEPRDGTILIAGAVRLEISSE